MPHLKIDIWDWVASVDIDDLIVEDSIKTSLGLNNVDSNVLSGDILCRRLAVFRPNLYHKALSILLTVRALSHFRGQDARVDAREKGISRGVSCIPL